jgi:RNA polymerase sigma factor (TIGR02999 family)
MTVSPPSGVRLKSLALSISSADNGEIRVSKKVEDVGPMADEAVGEVTAVLRAAQKGDREAAERLLALVYAELRRMAQARMRQLPPGQTLQPTALVHEAYLRLMGKPVRSLAGRKHFFFAAARAMRDILVEQARSKSRAKRGGNRRRVPMDEEPAVNGPPAEDILAVHEALLELEQHDSLKAQIVNLRYFAGMSADEAARVLGISESTLHRESRVINAWLKSRLGAPSR